MASRQSRPLAVGKQPPGIGEAAQPILCANCRMVRAETRHLTLHEGAVWCIGGRESPPVKFIVKAFTGPSFLCQIHLPLSLQQRVFAPGSAVEHGGGVRARCHGTELAIVLVEIDILRLVDFKQQARCCPHHVGMGIGR